ncbi:MAG: hypothetical protein AB1921_02725 [Thermodesulfobacteriota bacterium]
MDDQEQNEMARSLALISDFVEETAGRRPEIMEIVRALRRYFVLKEIKEHIELEWDGPC